MSANTDSIYSRIDNAFSFEARLVYGLGVPFLVGVGLIIAFALTGEAWLVAPMIIAVLALGAVCIVGIMRMLSEEEDEDEAARTTR